MTKASERGAWGCLAEAVVATACAATGSAALAQEAISPGVRISPTEPVPPAGAPLSVPTRSLETYVAHSNLTGNFPSWREAGLRALFETGSHLLQGELASMERWNESGLFVGLADRIIINEDWYTFFSVGAGDGASYLPRYRVDAFLHRKLLERRNLVATLGAGYYRAPDGHIDRNVNLGAIYYVPGQPLVFQGEVRFVHGSPGSVEARQQFVAATWGAVRATTLSARYAWGREAYQSIGADAVLTDFASNEASAVLRHWLGTSWGVELAAQRYSNPTYRRHGVTFRVFWQQ
jgi:YaiO family outer membrane protein